MRWSIVCAVFLLALMTRAWKAQQEVIANPDVIRYIDQAQGLGRDFFGTLRGEDYHPLHAGLGAVTHAVIGRGFSDDRLAWLWSLRVVGILAGAAVTIEILLLARLLGAPFWASVLAALYFLFARRTAVYGADGLSDMTAVAFFGAAMLVGLHALRFGTAGWLGRAGPWMRFAGAGVLSGISYLARPEGLAAVAILCGTVFLLAVARPAMPARRRWKLFPRRRLRLSYAGAAIACLIAGALLPALPYMRVKGRLTGHLPGAPTAVENAAPAPAALLHVPPGRVIVTIGRELFETFFWPGVIVLAGAVILRPRAWGRPRLRLAFIVWIAVWTAVMTWLLLNPDKGYLDGRHTLPLQLLLFALLALALAVWEQPMRAWMHWWRARPERWNRLPAWRRWPHWPRAFAIIVATLMLAPGAYEVTIPPRADKSHFIAAARWIEAHAAPGVVVVDYERLVGYYSKHPFAKWYGTPEKLELHQLDDIQRQTGHPLIIGMAYDPGVGTSGVGSAAGGTGARVPQLALGPFRAIAAFTSPLKTTSGQRETYVYVLYAKPGDKVLVGEAPALTTLPSTGVLPGPH